MVSGRTKASGRANASLSASSSRTASRAGSCWGVDINETYPSAHGKTPIGMRVPSVPVGMSASGAWWRYSQPKNRAMRNGPAASASAAAQSMCAPCPVARA